MSTLWNPNAILLSFTLHWVLLTIISSPACAKEVEGDELQRLLEKPDTAGIAYDPSKKLLVQLDDDRVRVWSLSERRLVRQFFLKGAPLAVALSRDGTEVVSAEGMGNLEYEATIKAWSLNTGRGRVVGRCLGSVTDLSFSPDGRRLAATVRLGMLGSMAGLDDDEDKEMCGGYIQVWRVSDGKELLKIDSKLPGLSVRKLRRFHNQSGIATDAAYEAAVRKSVPVRLDFSPNGKRLIAVSESGQQMVVDSRTGEKQAALKRPPSGEQQGADQPATAPESKTE